MPFLMQRWHGISNEQRTLALEHATHATATFGISCPFSSYFFDARFFGFFCVGSVGDVTSAGAAADADAAAALGAGAAAAAAPFEDRLRLCCGFASGPVGVDPAGAAAPAAAAIVIGWMARGSIGMPSAENASGFDSDIQTITHRASKGEKAPQNRACPAPHDPLLEP
jgi:hypothetical protein